MSTEQIQSAILEKQQRMVLLESEANQLEQQARDKRAERLKIKSDLADLGALHAQVTTMNAAQQAAAAAQQAQLHAQSHAADLQKLKDETAELNSQTAELNAQLRERLATLDTAKPAEPAPAA